jgi:cell division protein FtsQ
MVRPTPLTMLRRSVANGKLAALIMLLAGMGCLWYVFRSTTFVVAAIEVRGVRSLDPATISELAGVRGVSVWDIQPEAVAARIAQNTYVATATVDVLLPAQVIVHVQEREAVILWNSAGTNYEVTANGEVLGPARSDTTSALIIYDTRPAALAAGTRVDVDALELAQALNLRVPAEIGWQPSRYEWDPYYGLSLYNGAQQVAFGRMQDPNVPLDTKLATLKAVAHDGTVWTFLDLRPEKPYYRTPPQPTATPEP